MKMSLQKSCFGESFSFLWFQDFENDMSESILDNMNNNIHISLSRKFIQRYHFQNPEIIEIKNILDKSILRGYFSFLWFQDFENVCH